MRLPFAPAQGQRAEPGFLPFLSLAPKGDLSRPLKVSPRAFNPDGLGSTPRGASKVDFNEDMRNLQLEPGLFINLIGGNCPVQADGTFDGLPFYFRARGEAWAVRIAQEGEDPVTVGWGDQNGWAYAEDYGEGPFEAGWMDIDEALDFIRRSFHAWKAEGGPAAPFFEKELPPK